jgi:hypothetical protein
MRPSTLLRSAQAVLVLGLGLTIGAVIQVAYRR